MPRKPESRGTCAYCDEVVTKRIMAKHLDKCQNRMEVLQIAAASNLPVERLWRLRVQDAYLSDFWLDLEMNGSSTLDKLDKYLRAIWLECCGHLSKFTIGGWQGVEIAKSRKVNAIFEPGVVLRHLYDFGTTSETDIKVVDARQGKPTSRHSIVLLARNVMPEVLCQECGQPAKWLCIECVYEEEKPGYMCERHAEGHPHDNYGGPMMIYNSPRTGMCGYEGPAEPPY